jgi:hypothetical protein
MNQADDQTVESADLRDRIAEAIYAGGDEAEWLTTVDGSPNAASYDLADRALSVLPTPEALAAIAADMSRAHEAQALGVGRARIVACSGINDPLTGHWCQFRGSPQEQHRHLIERVAEALRDVRSSPGEVPDHG